MKKSIAAAALALSLATGGATGALLAGPAVAGAADAATGAAGWVQDALSGLVDDGTITQEQADAVEAALEDARPRRAFGHRIGLTTVADALGMSAEDLRAALADGATIAEVAQEQGVDVQDVIDAMVTAHRERVDEKVADGTLTQEQADEILARAEERATAIVNGERPAFGPGRHGRHGPSPRGWFRGDEAPTGTDSGTDTDGSGAETSAAVA